MILQQFEENQIHLNNTELKPSQYSIIILSVGPGLDYHYAPIYTDPNDIYIDPNDI